MNYMFNISVTIHFSRGAQLRQWIY